MSPARVLVTGAGGFTGHYVIEALRSRGDEVLGLEARAVNGEGPGTRRLDLLNDVTQLDDLVSEFEPTHVLHLAALSHVTGSRPEAHYAVNTVATENLLRALSRRAGKLRRIVLASTANVYGNAATSPISEDAPIQPMSHYGFSKWVMEQVAQRWFGELPVLVARPFNYTGVGQSASFVVPKIVEHHVRLADEIQMGNLDVSRDISDVRVVAGVYARLLESTAQEQVVNICSGRAVSLREILADMEQISGHRLPVRVDPALVRQNEIRELTGDATRLRQMLGPVEHPPMRETLAWMYSQASQSKPA